MSNKTEKQEDLLRLALEAHSERTAAWIRQEATKTHREQMRLGIIMAVLAICTAVALVVGIKVSILPADVLTILLCGGTPFFAFTVSAILLFYFARQQKKFM